VNRTGIWSALLLIPVVAVTPLRRLFGQTAWLAWLVQRRREIALASFAYASVHAAVYLIGKAKPGLVLQEAREPWLLAGWAALTIFLAPGTIRDEVIVTALRRRWERLHHLLYAGAVLIAVHWALSAFDPLTMQVQAALHAAGYYAGPIDGIIGTQSREALRQFQRDHRLTITGTITPEVLESAGIVAN
jgi:sulfoxide reductase heme-binding subunit YedZ